MLETVFVHCGANDGFEGTLGLLFPGLKELFLVHHAPVVLDPAAEQVEGRETLLPLQVQGRESPVKALLLELWVRLQGQLQEIGIQLVLEQLLIKALMLVVLIWRGHRRRKVESPYFVTTKNIASFFHFGLFILFRNWQTN